MHSNANLMKKRVLLKDNQNNELYPRPCLPIGTLMFFGNTFDPNTYFMGTWEKIEEEVFFMTASSDFPVGQVSGENTHTLTVDEIPAHKHDTTGGTYENTGGPYYWLAARKTVSGALTVKISSDNTGGGQPFDVRPKRYAVNAWVRVS